MNLIYVFRVWKPIPIKFLMNIHANYYPWIDKVFPYETYLILFFWLLDCN